VTRVEIKAIDPPKSVIDAMEKQMRAEREKRAAILTAEGLRQSKILTAEGEKQSQILTAEGDKQSQILRAEGQAQAIGTVFQAVHRNDADSKVLAYQYLQTLPKLAQSEGNTFWVIPSEVTTALKTVSSAFGGENAGQPAVPPGPDRPPAPGQLAGAAAAALTDGGPSSPAGNGDLARVTDGMTDELMAKEAAHTREELDEVHQEVAAVEREVAQAERPGTH
jgi:hypothetical protein